MSKTELRGASRRDFIKGSFAVGAALGWGPSKIWDFITRAGGDAMADCTTKGIQNVVFLVGGGGAHGYVSLLFPHPDIFQPGRTSPPNAAANQGDQASVHFLYGNDGGGGMAVNSFPALRTGLTLGDGRLQQQPFDYNSPPSESHPLRGTWAAGERYKFVYGVDNQAFRGFESSDNRSKPMDVAYWGASRIPSNVGADKTKNYLVACRETPWIHKYGIAKAITSIDGGGINSFHVNGAHNHFINFNKKQSVFAAAATIQLVKPTIVPVIMVGFMDASAIENLPDTETFYGAQRTGNVVPGQPAPALVNDPGGMVDLFNSNAAKAGGALVKPPGQTTAKNALLYEAYVKAMIGSSKTAKLPTFNRGYSTAKLGSNLVGLNLSDLLQVTDADKLRYGYTSNVASKFTELRDGLIIAAKALKLGLTSQVAIRFFNDDPHASFTFSGQSGNGDTAGTVALAMSNFLNAFHEDLMEVDDPFCPGIKLGNNTVIAFVGDTPRTQVTRQTWQDPTRGSQNRAWIMSNGILRTGFFGGDRNKFRGDNEGNTNDHNAAGPGEGGMWDYNTGDMIPFNGSQDSRRFLYGDTAMAAVLYAITRGDIRRVNDFYSGADFPAVQVPVLL